MSGDLWYFAYGSNLFVDQMRQRTGPIRQAIRSRLAGYRFCFNNRGDGDQVYAGIVRDEAADVWGVAYRCSPAALATMDLYEQVASGQYARAEGIVETDSGEKLNCVTYVTGRDFICESRRPTAEYLSRIITGARSHGLPADYIQTIEALAKPVN